MHHSSNRGNIYVLAGQIASGQHKTLRSAAANEPHEVALFCSAHAYSMQMDLHAAALLIAGFVTYDYCLTKKQVER